MSTETPVVPDSDRINRLYRELGLERGSKFRNGAYGAMGSGGMVRIRVGDLKWLLEQFEELQQLKAQLMDRPDVAPIRSEGSS